MLIGIVKYGMGNVGSVQKSIKKIGYDSIITDNQEELRKSDLILLPGVGSFQKGMENLQKNNLANFLTEEIMVNKKPFIGICLGMQLIATKGTEPISTKGLNWIEGEVVKIESSHQLRLPHTGWNNVKVANNSSFYKEFDNQDFYFIHNFYFKAKNKSEVVLSVDYGEEITAAIEKENIHAFQFHPEKSQKVGLQLLTEIIQKYA